MNATHCIIAILVLLNCPTKADNTDFVLQILEKRILTKLEEVIQVKLDNVTDELEERVNTLETEMNLVQESLMIFHDELNEAQSEINGLQTEDIFISERLLDVEGDILKNENDIDDLDFRLTALELTVSAHSTEISDLSSSQADIQQRLENLESTVNLPWTACMSSPCYNGATCIDVNVDTFICHCVGGFFGPRCNQSYENTVFFATITEEILSPVPDPVVFDLLRINRVPDGDNHYDNETGIYTAPLDGVYEFNIQIEANLDTDGDWNFVLVVDEDPYSYTRHTTYQTTEFISMSSTVLLHLSVGQQIWVSVAGLNAIWGTNTRIFSWFSGHLLFVD